MSSVENMEDLRASEPPSVVGFRLSPQQQRLWRLEREAGAPSPYLAACSVRITGSLEPRLLEAALRALAGRHEILRTSVRPVPLTDGALQVIADAAAVSLRVADLRGLAPAEREPRLAALWQEAARREDRGAELEPWLAAVGDGDHRLVLALTPYAMDALSFANLVRELAAAYAAAACGEAYDVEPLQYADLTEWQHQFLESAATEPARRFWREQEPAGLRPLELPFAGPSGLPFRPASLHREVSAELAAALGGLAAAAGGSLPILLFAAWQALLWRLGQWPEQAVGMVFGGRRHAELKGALGPLARSLPVRCRPTPGMRLADLAADLAESVAELAGWEECFTWPMPGEGREGEPRLAFGFAWQEPPTPCAAGAATFVIDRLEVRQERHDLELSCAPRAAGLALELRYDAGRYPPRLAALVSERLLALLAAVARAPETPLAALDLLGEEERRQLLVSFNDTAEEDEALGCRLEALFAEQEDRSP